MAFIETCDSLFTAVGLVGGGGGGEGGGSREVVKAKKINSDVFEALIFLFFLRIHIYIYIFLVNKVLILNFK